jgi:hypothetical protein
MCKFRCGSHKLPIEMGRFFSIDRSERICDLCNKEELGDEFHYLFNCTFFKDERIKFIPEYLYNVPNTISFSELMNSDDKYVLIGLSKIVMSVNFYFLTDITCYVTVTVDTRVHMIFNIYLYNVIII